MFHRTRECGIALGSQPGSRRVAGHQPTRTRLRGQCMGQCGSSAGWAAWDAKLVYASFRPFLEFINVFQEKRKP